MPKRSLPAYMLFANDQRDKVREDNPDIKFGEVGKLLVKKWKALNDEQKAPYDAKAAADKKRYEEEKAAYEEWNAAYEEEKAAYEEKKAAYTASFPTSYRRFFSLANASTVPKMPKRGLSNYMMFVKDQHNKACEDNPGAKRGEVVKILGEKWKGLNDEQKAPYDAKAAADKKRYEEEKAAYEEWNAAYEEEKAAL
ncbi:hypothetical protein KC357_g8879 [Hortaea werneckii]|nr:hypothetical protein KC357_g8879 [Hortaea werneckii]